MEHQPRSFECTLQVRGYELDGNNHVNHAVYLNYFEHARFLALEVGGLPLPSLAERGWEIHVVRIEVDYRRPLRLGDRVQLNTWVAEWKTTRRVIRQTATSEGNEVAAAEARVVAVWIGPDGKPMRIPDEGRAALGGTPAR